MSTHRERLIEYLELLASAEAQLAYQRAVPIADVPSELFCQWEELFSPRWDLGGEFTGPEQAGLLDLHDIFERVGGLLPVKPLPPIEQFVSTPQWLGLSRGAQRALRILKGTTGADGQRGSAGQGGTA